jgi:hypothetical protein
VLNRQPLNANALYEKINSKRTTSLQMKKITYRISRYRTTTSKYKDKFLRPKEHRKINAPWRYKRIKARENHYLQETKETIPNEEVD